MLPASLAVVADPALAPLPGSSASRQPVPTDPATLADDADRLLDEPEAWVTFSRSLADQPGCWESQLVIEGMHCTACALSVEDALRALPGVREAVVSAGSRRARVVWSSDAVRPSDWARRAPGWLSRAAGQRCLCQ
jgi:Cu2+-exporting ATPase